MYQELDTYPPGFRWKKAKRKTIHGNRRQTNAAEGGFICQNCGAYVYTLASESGVQNRNHCPFCLWSRHLDHLQAGDRMSACKAVMQPIGLTVKPTRNKYACCAMGELMLIHQCSDCGKLSINRIAADDQAEAVTRIYHTSLWLDEVTRNLLADAGIRPLQGSDKKMLIGQLYGLFSLE